MIEPTADWAAGPLTMDERFEVRIHESVCCWTRLLRRDLPDQISVVQGVRLADIDLTRSVDPPAVSILVASAREHCLALRTTHYFRLRRRDARIFVIAENARHARWYLQTVGATMVWDRSRWPLPAVVGLIRQCWSLRRQPTLSLEDRIWKNLPW